MNLDLDQLEALAKAATSGPYTAFRAAGSICIGDTREASCIEDIHRAMHIEVLGGDNIIDNAAYFAALSPETILELIRRLREAESRFYCVEGLLGNVHRCGPYMDGKNWAVRIESRHEATSLQRFHTFTEAIDAARKGQV